LGFKPRNRNVERSESGDNQEQRYQIITPKREIEMMKRKKELSVTSFISTILIFISVVFAEEQCLKDAWTAFNKKNYEKAISFANDIIDNYGKAAYRIQENLVSSKAPLPLTGTVSAAEKDRIFTRGLLNDVSTACWIKGRAAENLYRKGGSQKEKYRIMAIEAYKETGKYKYGRTWDPKGWFWSPYEAAKDRLPLNDSGFHRKIKYLMGSLACPSLVIPHPAIGPLVEFGEVSVPFLIEALSYNAECRYYDPVLEKQIDANPQIHKGAIIALSEIGILHPTIRPILIKSLHDEDTTVRSNIARVFEKMGPTCTSAIPQLILLLADKDHTVRTSAKKALQHIGFAKYSEIDSLNQLKNHPNKIVSTAATQFLQKTLPQRKRMKTYHAKPEFHFVKFGCAYGISFKIQIKQQQFRKNGKQLLTGLNYGEDWAESFVIEFFDFGYRNGEYMSFETIQDKDILQLARKQLSFTDYFLLHKSAEFNLSNAFYDKWHYNLPLPFATFKFITD
jgi:hypothetical protein